MPRTVVMVVVIALVGHGARSLTLPAPAQPLIQFAALVATLALMFAREKASFGFLPGPASLQHLRDLLAQGRDYAIATQPPAGPDEGLLLIIVAGIGMVALAVDTLAAGLDLPGMTLIPLASLFVLPWAIGQGSAPGWTFVAVAVGWLAVVAALQSQRVSGWSPGARAGTPGIGLVIAAITITIALVAGGLTPLLRPAETVDIGSGPGGGTVEVDALVSLRRSLVSNDTRPVITLATTATRPDYLRLSVLELFNGEQWQPVGPNETGPQPPPRADGSVPSVDQPPGVPVAEYQLDVGPLGGTTLPSPSGSYLSLTDWPVVWDQRTSLPLRADGDTVEGARISLVAAAQDLDADGLRAASTVPPRPEQVFGENLADPTPLTGPELPQLARDITAGSATPFDAAIALQKWFTTDGGFTYSTQIEGGSDEDALATFLEERVGYCEQFAATMALMARSVGIPARVVVGFTQGRLEGNQWVVRGTDAHAWPELWMGSAGWVRFEPTPGAPTTSRPAYSIATPGADGPSATPTQRSASPSQEATGPYPGTSRRGGRGPGAGVIERRASPSLAGLLHGCRACSSFRRRRDSSGVGAACVPVTGRRPTGRSSTPWSTSASGRSPPRHARHWPGSPPWWRPEVGPSRHPSTRQWRGSCAQWSGSATAPRGRLPCLPEPDLTSAASPEGEQGAGVLLAERQAAGPSGTRPGALAGDMRIVRRALARRAGWVRPRGGSPGAAIGDHGTGCPGAGRGRLGRGLGCGTDDPTRSTDPETRQVLHVRRPIGPGQARL